MVSASAIKILPPDLNLDINKITAANAQMPDLIFELQTAGFNIPAHAKYKWWVRVQYETTNLNMQKAAHTIGCDRPIPLRRIAVWALPSGTMQEVCTPNMSTRNIWITTAEPRLNLSGPLRIEQADGSSHIVHTKNKKGEPLDHKGMLLYGGGQVEVAAIVEFFSPRGIKLTYSGRFPSRPSQTILLQKLRGLNPSPKEQQNQYQLISNALFTTNPTPNEQQIRKQISGSKNTAPIPNELHQVLPAVLDAIACRETRRHQFCQQKFCIGVEREQGFPIVSWDGGYGMFQLTIPHPTYYQKWSWKENLTNTLQRLYPHFSNTTQIANSMPNPTARQRVYYREIISRHNASGIGYYEKGKRRPILCREKIAFDNNAPNTNPLYRKNLENNTALLQALDLFGRKLRTAEGIQCSPGYGRKVILGSRGNIIAVSACRPGKSQIIRGRKTSSVSKIPVRLIAPLRRFAGTLLDNKLAACNGPRFNKNAGRRIVGTFSPPNIYNISLVGLCHNSPTCYVDVDSESRNNIHDACISPEARRSF